MAKVEYFTSTEDVITTHIIKWFIPITLLENKTTRELRSNESEDISNTMSSSQFLLKIQILGHCDHIFEICYLALNPAILAQELKFPTNIICAIDGNNVTQGYRKVQAHKWQYMKTLKNPHKDLTLIFKFFVIKMDRSNIHEAQLCNDLEQMLNNSLFSDVTVKSADEVEYKVHKAVLASRSAVLKAHFEHNTTECFTNVVESPLESEVLREVLTFIYSDKAPRVDEIPEKLLVAADYYQLSGLKSLCEEALHKKLTVENAIQTLQLADLHSANTLKKLTLEFIEDEIKLFTKTEAWTKLISAKRFP